MPFLKIWRRADQFDPGERSGVTWIYKIARDLRLECLGMVVGHFENWLSREVSETTRRRALERRALRI